MIRIVQSHKPATAIAAVVLVLLIAAVILIRFVVPASESCNTRDVSGQRDIDLNGYCLTFSDEFDSLSVSSSSPKGARRWYAYPPYGAAGSYSLSRWDPSTLGVADGVLHIGAIKDVGTWRSGNISSVDEKGHGFHQRFGYFEARIKMPNAGTGAWPAFWLMTTSGISALSKKRAAFHEVDVVEWYGMYNSAAPRAIIQQASHNYLATGGQTPVGRDALYAPETPMPKAKLPWLGYHVYGVQIAPHRTTWYVDGTRTNSIVTPTKFITGPYYMMLDYAIGGGHPDTGMPLQSRMEVDWVRVYNLPSQHQ